jgi:hypothetical protein
MDEQTKNYVKFLHFIEDTLSEIMLAVVEDEDLDAAYLMGSLTSAIAHKICALDPDHFEENDDE